MSILALNRILTEKVLLVSVAVKTSALNTFLAYQAIIPVTDLDKEKDKIKPGALQAVADYGTKLPEEIARVMFPQFKEWHYAKTDRRHRCRKCRSIRNEIFLIQVRDKWQCAGICNIGGRGFKVKKVTQMFIHTMEEEKKKREIVLPLTNNPALYPNDITLEEITDGIITLTKILHSKTSKREFQNEGKAETPGKILPDHSGNGESVND